MGHARIESPALVLLQELLDEAEQPLAVVLAARARSGAKGTNE